MSNDQFVVFEKRVMKMLLAGDDPALQVLRDQYARSCVFEREFTGVGFYTTFGLPQEVPHLPGNPAFCFGDVAANIEGIEGGAGFLLWVTEGAIDFLEGYTYTGDWPLLLNKYTLEYFDGERDLTALHRGLAKER